MPLQYRRMTTSVKPTNGAAITNRLEALRLQLMAGELAEQIGARIRARREELGLNQRELAEKLPAAVSNQHVSNWERGVYRPSDKNLPLIAEALDVSVDYLYGAKPQPQTPDLMRVLGEGSVAAEIKAQLDAIQEELAELRAAITTRAANDLLSAAEGDQSDTPAARGRDTSARGGRGGGRRAGPGGAGPP